MIFPMFIYIYIYILTNIPYNVHVPLILDRHEHGYGTTFLPWLDRWNIIGLDHIMPNNLVIGWDHIVFVLEINSKSCDCTTSLQIVYDKQVGFMDLTMNFINGVILKWL